MIALFKHSQHNMAISKILMNFTYIHSYLGIVIWNVYTGKNTVFAKEM